MLFLTRYPIEGASSRYRVYQYVPYLEALGVQCEVQSFMDAEMYKLSFTPGKTRRKVWATLKATLHRLKKILHFRDYDIVYMQRELLPFGPPLIERFMKGRGTKLFFDYDDALFIKKSSRYNPIATFLRSPKKTLKLFRLVDCVIAGNDWLRDRAREQGANALTLEVAEDTTRIGMHAPHSNHQPITIGWLGSKSTVKYLRIIEPALQEIATCYPNLRFEIMGGGDFAMEGVPWVLNEWSLDEELEALARFDIGLMPLPIDEWSNGKSGGKARTYMAAGVVPVCSAIGYNLELIDDGQTGFLCETHKEWKEKICKLIEDPALRQRLSVDARKYVEKKFNVRTQAEKLHNIFREVLESTYCK